MTREILTTQPEMVQIVMMQAGIKEYNDLVVENGQDPLFMESRDGQLVAPRGDKSELIPLTAEALGTLIRLPCTPVAPKKKDKTKKKDGEAGSGDDDGDGGDDDDDSDEVTAGGGAPLVEQVSWQIRRIKSYIGLKQWPGVPKIRQVVRAPLIRPDFSIRWEPGWDRESNCYVVPGIKPDYTMVKENTNLAAIFGQFALADKRFIPDVLAAALTPYLMSALPGSVPGLLVTANMPGSGKTYLAQMTGLLGNCGSDNGTLPSVTAWKSAEAMGTLITSAVKGDDRLMILDNIKTDIDCAELEAVLTSRSITDRRFHAQDMMKLRSNTTWFMTTNGAVASADMLRRCVVVLMDKRANPVAWDGKVIPWLWRHERMLVTLMVTLIERWRDAGMIWGGVIHPGFEEWSGVASGILECSGYEGMFAMRGAVLDENVATDMDDTVELLNRIARIMGTDTVWRAGDLWDITHDYLRSIGHVYEMDIQYVRAWLDKVGKDKKDMTMVTGRALAKLVGKTWPGVAHTLERVGRAYVCRGVLAAVPLPA